MAITISSCVIELIQQAAAEALPEEACGLLFGTGGHLGRASVTANVAADPRRHFEIDAAALFAALRAERGGGERLAGYWHSHPGGDADPSATDAAMAVPDGKLWLIVANETLKLWRAVENGARHGRFDPVAFDVR
ncbi:Mov34/MPN/PAD-1 family protein [Sphingomonas sp. MG17]|uniref:Mov34/MPN/PAD-1 family protein n=1 Tax=Sphingomonas tagetis TaxID=2949092 RepID=A0A9X2HM90_9SPHN|nr:Mov34/MPN/PAD-1 family protein [Sphingomonas tagetis]MCP3731879.1 Mov34/MPN/PAD-1 family protein [Sphingomonas tagetis]